MQKRPLSNSPKESISVSPVRASRDGDQFHYLWAARRCLLLLAPATDLVGIAIEGASTDAEPADVIRPNGIDEIIDVAEYYGSNDLEHASAVRYAQLKHSTLHAGEYWPPSKLEKTLSRFAEKFRHLEQQLGWDRVLGRFSFAFVSNRPVDPKLVETVDDIVSGGPVRHPSLHKTLSRYTGLDGERLRAFVGICRRDSGTQPTFAARQHQ